MLGVCSLSVQRCCLSDCLCMFCYMAMRQYVEKRIRDVQMDNLRGFLGIRRMDRIPNAQIRELCGLVKGVDERIAESIFLTVLPY